MRSKAVFVAPERLRGGIGARLLAWAIDLASRRGARALVIEADPDAVAFYRRRGATPGGSVPSGSIPGRMLPRLMIALAPQ
ncbi:MAG: GNAT family N-acetyltransferase [Alphaproteobacteria bacterium]|nr:GNAT family N-acetyltransferase [Alphaproteobacteria bacterium]